MEEEIIKKKCSKCQEEKTLDQFHKCKGKKYDVQSSCKTCQQIRLTDWKKNNPTYYDTYKEQWTIDNSDYNKEYNENNKEHLSELNKQYYKDNKTEVIAKVMAYRDMKRKTDPFFKFKDNTRNLIRNAFKRAYTTKSKKTNEILGCKFDVFKVYLEEKFKPEMNWDNFGSYWVLDHIKPISLATTEEEVYALNHYTNFQPLTALENQVKYNKY